MTSVLSAQPHDQHGYPQSHPSDMGAVLTLLTPTGGMGASTLAANLAVRLAAKWGNLTSPVALFDADLAFGCATSMVGARPPHTLADLPRQVTGEVLSAAVQAMDCGIHVLASPSDLIVAESVVPATCARVIRVLAARHAATVIDTAPGLFEPTLTAVDHADLVLIPVVGTPHACRATAMVMSTLRRVGVAEDRIRLVANRVGAPHAMSPSQIADALATRVSWLVPDSPDVILAARKGRLLAWDWPDHPVSLALDQLASDVADMVGGPNSRSDAGSSRDGLRRAA